MLRHQLQSCFQLCAHCVRVVAQFPFAACGLSSEADSLALSTRSPHKGSRGGCTMYTTSAHSDDSAPHGLPGTVRSLLTCDVSGRKVHRSRGVLADCVGSPCCCCSHRLCRLAAASPSSQSYLQARLRGQSAVLLGIGPPIYPPIGLSIVDAGPRLPHVVFAPSACTGVCAPPAPLCHLLPIAIGMCPVPLSSPRLPRLA